MDPTTAPAPRRPDHGAAELVEARRRAGSRAVSLSTLVACGLSTPFLLVVLAWVDRALGVQLLLLVGCLSACEFFALRAVRSGRHRAWHDWLATAVEVSAPTAIALVDAGRIGPAYALTSAPVMLYGLPVMMSALRLRPRLALFAGAIGSVQLLALYLWIGPGIPAALVEQLPSLAAWNVLLRSAYVMFAGVCAWWLSHAQLSLVGRLSRELDAKRESEERYRTLTESSSDGILRLDAELRLLFANRAARALLGLPPAGLDGLPLDQVPIPEPVRGRLGEEVTASLGAGGRSRAATLESPGPDQPRWLECQVVPAAAAGEQRSALVTLRDVTARVRAELEARSLEERLRQAQKMDAVGRLAGGVAHDFNNILTGIIGSAQFLAEDRRADDPVRAEAEEVLIAARRAAALVRQLLTFSRQQKTAPRLLDLNEHVAQALNMVRRTLSEDVELVTTYLASPALVLADPGQLDQVLLNLAINARDAMPDGGRITVETRNARAGEGGQDAMVALSVGDTGCGIPDTVRAKVFDPFFTTKPVGKGTGLGLATVHGIVQEAGGTISIADAPGGGTVFEVLLPAARGTAPEAERDAPRAPRGAGEVVLVVEDSDHVRATTCRLLRAAGYQVVEAGDGEEGVRRHEAAGRVDLLLSDVVMPRMGGPALFDALAARQPGLRVLFVTGHLDDRLPVPDAAMPVLRKPFSADQLLIAVRQVLEAGAPPGAATPGPPAAPR